MLNITRSITVSIYNDLSKYWKLIVCLSGIILRHTENTALKSYDIAQFLCEKIVNGLKYVIQSLCACCKDLWLFPLTKKTLSD